MYDGFNKRTRSEVLTCVAFACVLFQKSAVEFSESFLCGAIPVDLIDCGNERVQVPGLNDSRLGVIKDCSYVFAAIFAKLPNTTA